MIVAWRFEDFGRDASIGSLLWHNFVFRSKRNDRLWMLTYDGSGIVLVSKWLEAGRFTWPPIREGAMC
jgi:transposase